jgi:hypothetical protein
MLYFGFAAQRAGIVHHYTSDHLLEKLKHRWKLGSIGQVIIVLIVFACTGTTVLLIKKPLLNMAFPDGQHPMWFSILYYILILPVYNVFLLIYGALFGQFKFFWEFEKRFFNRMLGRGKQ